MLTSRIRNTNSDGKPFSFTFAYHTYFLVSDIRFANYFLVSPLHLFYLLNIFLQSFLVSITALHSPVISTACMMPKCDFCNRQRKDRMVSASSVKGRNKDERMILSIYGNQMWPFRIETT